ncbi:MAG: arylesterase [Rhodocyclaceae bacterium]|nr:arylesterase [Rhodocyclaceae bacterium]MDZ4215113.1 arylesterase [Rhodocyclaceae bacterium]
MRSAHAAPTILVFGDSLSAGYGIELAQSWPSLMADRLKQEKFPHALVNASISGETTAGGRTRLPALLKQHRPAVVVLALGANDGLRGLPIEASRANLQAMAKASRQAGARVLIAGMRLPPNYGTAYTQQFSQMFADVAKAEKSGLLPFLLEPIALDDAAFQPDRLHPTAAAQPKIRDHIWPAVKALLKPR